MRSIAVSLILGGTNLTPNAGNLPGASVLQQLADGLDGWALLAAVIGIVVGAVMWAFGHYSQNYQQAYNGRRGVMVSALAGLLIGGAPHIIDFFVNQGGKI
jgi:type IV secretory pathway VirB2 component (pilin)